MMSRKHKRRRVHSQSHDPGPSGSGVAGVSILKCIFCKASLHYEGEKAARYHDHLFKEHNILFEAKSIVDRTLVEQGLIQEPTGERPKTLDFSCQFNETCLTENLKIVIKSKPTPPANIPPKSIKVEEILRKRSPPREIKPVIVPISPKTLKKSSPRKRKWFERCEFACPVCKSIFYNQEELEQHYVSTHPRSSVVNFSVTKPFEYECEICCASIQHSEASIEEHLKKNHDMTIAIYEGVFRDGDDQDLDGPETVEKAESKSDRTESIPDSIEDITGLDEPDSHLVDIDMLPESSQARDPPTPDPGEEIVYSKEDFLRGFCVFQCGICQFQIHASNLFWDHVANVHSITMENYKESHKDKDYMIKTEKIECSVCFKLVKHEPVSLAKHCSKVHGLTMEEFYDKYHNKDITPEQKCSSNNKSVSKNYRDWMAKTLTSYQCQLCDKSFPQVLDFSKHLEIRHQLRQDEYEVQFGSTWGAERTYCCKVCKRQVSAHYKALYNHLSIHNMNPRAYFLTFYQETTDEVREWLKGCEYRCRICDTITWEYGELKNHLKMGHQMNEANYTSNFGQMMSSKVEKECSICKEKVLWYAFSVQKHMKKHGHSPVSYYYEYVANKSSGQSCAPVPLRGRRPRSRTKFVWNKNPMVCKLCGTTYASRNTAKMHVNAVHPGVQATDVLVLKNQFQIHHECLICKKKILHDNSVMYMHLHQVHKIKIQEYETKFETELRQQPDETVEGKMSPVQNDRVNLGSINRHYSKFNWNKNPGHCSLCFKTFTCRANAFYNHIKSAHADKRNDVIYVHESPEVFHQCLVCRRSISCDSRTLTLHVKNQHKINLMEYEEQYYDQISQEIGLKDKSSRPGNPMIANKDHDVDFEVVEEDWNPALIEIE